MESLLHYFTLHPPDLEKRNHIRSTLISSDNQDSKTPTASDGILVVPKPKQSTIFATDHLALKSLEDVPSSKVLVSPLLWIPGVLRACGSWSIAMKDTDFGEAFVTKSEDIHVSPQERDPGPAVLGTILGANEIILTLEKTVCRQKALNEKLVRSSTEQLTKLRRDLEKVRDEEVAKCKETMKNNMEVSTEAITRLKQELKTVKMASNIRYRRAFAQDNFLSSYSKAMLTIRDQARELARKELSKLEDQVGALSRRVLVDAQYKRTLQRRTEAAESAAEKRWQSAERKIPLLEQKIHTANARAEKLRLSDWGEKSTLRRNVERLSAELQMETERHQQTTRMNEELKQQLKEMEMRWRAEKLRLKDKVRTFHAEKSPSQASRKRQ